MTDGTFRATSRVLLYDADDRVLLFLQYGKDHDVPPRWITPGGGVDPGEDHDQAAIRELQEETGLIVDRVPSPFFEEDFAPDQRWHPYQRGHWAWYALRVEHFEPARDGWTEEEQADVLGWRWFSAAELEATTDEVEPANLAAIIQSHTPERT